MKFLSFLFALVGSLFAVSAAQCQSCANGSCSPGFQFVRQAPSCAGSYCQGPNTCAAFGTAFCSCPACAAALEAFKSGKHATYSDCCASCPDGGTCVVYVGCQPTSPCAERYCVTKTLEGYENGDVVRCHKNGGKLWFDAYSFRKGAACAACDPVTGACASRNCDPGSLPSSNGYRGLRLFGRRSGGCASCQ